MKTFLVNGEFEIEARDLSTAYELANEMGIEIESVDILGQWCYYIHTNKTERTMTVTINLDEVLKMFFITMISVGLLIVALNLVFGWFYDHFAGDKSTKEYKERNKKVPNDIADVLKQTWDNMTPEEQEAHRKMINSKPGMSASMKNIPNIH